MFSEKNVFLEMEKRIKKKRIKSSTLSCDCLALGGLLLMYPIAAHGAETLKPEENKIEISSKKNLEAANPQPEDYDLEKIAALDLRYIEEKKSCEEEAAIKIISGAILFDHYEFQKSIDILETELYEYDAAHPEFKDVSLEEKMSASPEFNALYKTYQTAQIKATEFYESIMNASVEETRDRLNNESISDSIKECVDNSQEILKVVEAERVRILESINNEEYLRMIQVEFNCSLEEAKAHQQTRYNNVKNVNYYFRSSQILDDNHGGAGFFVKNSNVIFIPYDIDFKKDGSHEVELSFFKEIVAHELWHAATNANDGLSLSAKALLEITRDQLKNHAQSYNIEYYGDPTERYVRFKSLESELTEMKIWSKGQIFSADCYINMIDAYTTKKFKQSDSYQFIKSILVSNSLEGKSYHQIFSDIFNSIASLETNKTYYPEQWWGAKEEKA